VESAFQQREEDAQEVWGWGPEDHLFYRDAFARADALHAESVGVEGARPLFLTLATISNHMRFNVPAHRRTLFPNPQSAEESYLNALHLSDADLAAFIREVRSRPWLDDALVVITGDHSFPTGQHDVSFNEVGVFEESFRTPLLVWWPGHLPPKRITSFEASQLDIAPSILDLLGIQVIPNHFMGQSLWSERPHAPVPLVQPYNGEYWGAVGHKLKYLIRNRTEERLVFDLAQDPGEMTNRADEAQLLPSLEPHRETIASLSVVRAALENNAVWPPSDQ
jgi:phosphoglycerol transferase MdoB-like AlkP superfamily enzyme